MNIVKELNHFNKGEEIQLLFDELFQYKNIKSFEFGTINDDINSYLNIFNEEHSFIKN